MPGEVERGHDHAEKKPVTDHATNNTAPLFTHYKVTSPSAGGPSFRGRLHGAEVFSSR